ncbi:transporter substrate-binding domain-containing protein [Terasakiella sp. A23]|uniref:substrate-binding periplasmic protein n=1 Tax=Terasakiella sp. FCG-A23 TaxID=3080561 RepID=UPI00295512EA|nr:transporter substrate-binding domain-containing protein [Terasakiella sp. A23]MDV7338331.1 transporter substrate-binding domain-containing protein [Terasakiella sp. A23]
MRLLVIMLVFLLSAQDGRAEQYNVAVAHIPPFAMKRDTGPEGILVDITSEAFGRLGHSVNFQFLPWPRAINYMNIGKVDAIVPFFKNPERVKFAEFPTKGLLQMDIHFFKRKGSAIQVSSVEDAKDYRIARVSRVNLGGTFAAYEERQDLKIDQVNNTGSGIKVLVNSRVELLASVKRIAEYAAAQLGMSHQIEVAGKAFDQHVAYLAFAKSSKSVTIAPDIWAEIEKMRINGRIDALTERYLSYIN